MTKAAGELDVVIIAGDRSLVDMVGEWNLVNRCEFISLSDEKDLLARMKKINPHIIILDWDALTPEGRPLLAVLKKEDPRTDVLIAGEGVEGDEIMSFINLGATAYLPKPVDPNALKAQLKSISEKKSLRRETYMLERQLEQKYLFQGMVGKNPYMLEIFSLIEKVARYFSTILITGETGTGKEMIAAAVHALSDLNHKKMVICDCVSIPDNLFESELFGYVKGAFTGADRDKKGLFAESHGGIIFLDEIGDIPISVQAKLLRVLEYHQYRPLGSNTVATVDVKVIASTNRDLAECVRTGTFREDLFHRINKVEIHLPSLRERPEDISLLTRYFLNGFNTRFSKSVKGVSRQVQKLFFGYDWPGNIRELENVMERAVMLCSKDFIDIDDLPKKLQEKFTSTKKIPYIDRENLGTLEDMEKDYISYLLKLTGNNMQKTASILNISRTTLYNKLEKYKISRNP